MCVCERRCLGWRGTCVCMLEEGSRLEGHMCVYVEEESRLEGHMCVYVRGGLGWKARCIIEDEWLEGHMCVYVRGGV